MCGIVGIYAYASEAPRIDEREIILMRDQMTPRGPDGCGIWAANAAQAAPVGVCLAHRRLAIVDLSEGGAQPMHSACGRYVVTFNGEIYNYPSLRKELEQQGVVFRSDSDTEVLLHLYARIGDAMCDRLRGMFAFAIWDSVEKTIFLGRDTFGIKPLYLHDNGAGVRFASQVKALLAGDAIQREPEPAAVVGAWLLGHVPEPWTLIAGVQSLPAGHSLKIWPGGRRELKPFWTVEQALSDQTMAALSGDAKLVRNVSQKSEFLRAALLDTVSHHLMADVPVGVFLSSGIDSTTLAALAAEAGAELRTVTLGFDEYRGSADDESPLAEAVARHYSADHQTVWLKKDEFLAELPQLLDAMDQPTIDGVNSYFVSKAAVQAGLKVALSGLGGDEIFGGYPSFEQIPRMVGRLRALGSVPGLGVTARHLLRPIVSRFAPPKSASLLEFGGSYEGMYLLRRGLHMPWELDGLIEPGMLKEGLEKLALLQNLHQSQAVTADPFRKVSVLEASWYMRSQLLRDTDWASMAHSIEIRVPLVDRELLRRVNVMALAGFRPRKADLGASARPTLPERILNRPKTGFTVPVRQWMQEHLQQGYGLRSWLQFTLRKQFGVL